MTQRVLYLLSPKGQKKELSPGRQAGVKPIGRNITNNIFFFDCSMSYILFLPQRRRGFAGTWYLNAVSRPGDDPATAIFYATLLIPHEITHRERLLPRNTKHVYAVSP